MPEKVRTASGEEMLNLRRRRMAASPPLLRGGFRPFFLGGSIWAIAALVIWLYALTKGESPVAHLDALAWHRHEMLFGFVGAVVAGFILTAVPNWTGRLPIAGWPLGLLASTWLAARLLPLGGIGTPLAWGLLDSGFFIILAGLILREIVLAGNRNLPIALMIILFGIADAADLAAGAGILGDPSVAIRAGLSLVIMMIALIGGRITPSFTRNWLMKQGEKKRLPVQPDRFDKLVLLVSFTALTGYVFMPSLALVGWALVAIGSLHAFRLARWRVLSVVRDPIVLILHVGYAWVPAGLVLLGLSILSSAIPLSASIHALTAGAMATMILAVMCRATLGHTGRELKADGLTVLLFLAITIAALLRVSAPLGWGDYTLQIHLSAFAWIAAFCLFLVRYGPMLVTARIDGISESK